MIAVESAAWRLRISTNATTMTTLPSIISHAPPGAPTISINAPRPLASGAT